MEVDSLLEREPILFLPRMAERWYSVRGVNAADTHEL